MLRRGPPNLASFVWLRSSGGWAVASLTQPYQKTASLVPKLAKAQARRQHKILHRSSQCGRGGSKS